MSKKEKAIDKLGSVGKRLIVITLIGTLTIILLMVATLDISHRNLNTFISTQQKYILSTEGVILVAFVVEMLARLVTMHMHTPRMIEFQMRLRFIVRIIGYSVGLLSIVSILSSNAALGISVGAIVGAIVVVSAQNIVASVLASILILGTRIVHVGEEITVGQTNGIIEDITLTHTIIAIEEDVVFIPNSMMISSPIRRKKRNSNVGRRVNDW